MDLKDIKVIIDLMKKNAVSEFELEEGEFGFVDSGWAGMKGTLRLLCHMTVRAGEVVWDLNGLSRPGWELQGDYIRLA